jgi:hypothetical protein
MFSAIAGLAFIGFSFLLPQAFHPAAYPLVAILVWRSILALRLARKNHAEAGSDASDCGLESS